MRIPRRVTVCALASAIWASSAAADEVVRFADGRVLEVARVERNGDTIRLELLGGGALAVPAWRVDGWSRVERAALPPRGSANRPPEAWRNAAGVFARHIERAATEHRLDPVLLTAVAHTESAFDPAAVSPKGATGLMQLMPETAARLGVADVFDVAQNVDGGARYLSWLLDRFDGNTELALAGYNAGENAVDRYRGIPPYPETERYVEKVLHEADRLRRPAAATAAADLRLTSVAPAVAD